MKHLVSLTLLALSLHGQPPPQGNFRVKCHEQYTADMLSTLNQFAGFTKPAELKNYRDFMLRAKQESDLGDEVRHRENQFTSDIRALWRTPLQHYNDCRTAYTQAHDRTFIQQSLPKTILAPCDQTYAAESKILIDHHRNLLSPSDLQWYLSYLVMLKQRTDLAFYLGDFERLIPNPTIAKPYGPLRRYQNCIDANIRNEQPYATYGTHILGT
jgi:hypothetical protein